MKYYLDTEFIDDGKTVELISIGVVAEDGREYYAINNEADLSKASEWVATHVVNHLPDKADKSWKSRATIRDELLQFLVHGGLPTIYGWFSAYDFLVFCQLWGTMMSLPRQLPHFFVDLRTIMEDRNIVGIPRPKQSGQAHKAIDDARWTKEMHEWILSLR